MSRWGQPPASYWAEGRTLTKQIRSHLTGPPVRTGPPAPVVQMDCSGAGGGTNEWPRPVTKLVVAGQLLVAACGQSPMTVRKPPNLLAGLAETAHAEVVTGPSRPCRNVDRPRRPPRRAPHRPHGSSTSTPVRTGPAAWTAYGMLTGTSRARPGNSRIRPLTCTFVGSGGSALVQDIGMGCLASSEWRVSRHRHSSLSECAACRNVVSLSPPSWPASPSPR